MENNLSIYRSTPQTVVNMFCDSLKINKDHFFLIDFSTLYHGSGMFFDFENEILGYMVGEDGQSEKRFYNIEKSDKDKILFYINQWFEWYETKKSEYLLDRMNSFGYQVENTDNQKESDNGI